MASHLICEQCVINSLAAVGPRRPSEWQCLCECSLWVRVVMDRYLPPSSVSFIVAFG